MDDYIGQTARLVWKLQEALVDKNKQIFETNQALYKTNERIRLLEEYLGIELKEKSSEYVKRGG